MTSPISAQRMDGKPVNAYSPRWAHCWAGALREFDMIGRFGSDQFLLVLPNVRINDAMIGLERVLEVVEATYSHNDRPPLTISGGVTEYSGEDSPALIEHLRPLLSAAQEAGGNRLCVDLEIF
jgi:GGDEF domain-containing protein